MIKLSIFVLLFGLVIIRGIYPFLAINHPVQAHVLIIEGWVPMNSIKFAVEEFYKNHYDFILTNGGQINPESSVKSMNEYAAELAKKRLMELGIDGSKIHTVKTTEIYRSRTYSYALDTLEWLMKHKKSIKKVNILTLGSHARKSYVLYQKAANKKVDVGIISTPPVCYNPSYWYISKKGIYSILRNLVGYLYAVIL